MLYYPVNILQTIINKIILSFGPDGMSLEHKADRERASCLKCFNP